MVEVAGNGYKIAVGAGFADQMNAGSAMMYYTIKRLY